MPLADVVTLVDHVGAGLQAAWEAGIVHRDIKPQNIFRSQEPHGPATWKILDFGVSKMAHQNNTLTQGNIIGTPSYMAPEQVEGQQLDHRADLFALAAVAYRALTGRPAFGGDKLPVVLYRVVYGMPEAPSSMVAVPADVDLVFARALAKRPEDRYTTTAELGRSLALAARGQLTESMRTRARALVRRHPWGTLLRPQDQRSAQSRSA
jgi:serine/threonine-protein kinase